MKYTFDKNESIINNINVLERRSKILAFEVKKILNLKISESYLKTIFIPFLSIFAYWNIELMEKKRGERTLVNLDELFHLFIGDEARGKEGKYGPNQYIGGSACDFLVSGNPNIFEKIVYRIHGISHEELKSIEAKEEQNIEVNNEIRKKITNSLANEDSELSKQIKFLPLTLLEGLFKLDFESKRIQIPRVHALGLIFNENYLHYLAAFKENNTIIVGQPHGGCYGQIKGGIFNELAEKALCDIYHMPSWNPSVKAFSNLRASRNLFINLKHSLKLKKKKNKALVLLGYFYIKNEPTPLNPMIKNGSINEFYEKKIKELKYYFNKSFDFKLYVRQKEDVDPKIKFIKINYPNSEIIISNRSVIEISKEYESIIHMDTWGTAIMELASSRVQQYTYIGPELNLNDDYRNFLYNTRKNSTKKDKDGGFYVLIDNLKYRKAYGASFLYPFYLSRLINKFKL